MNVHVTETVLVICVAALMGGCMVRGHYRDQEYTRVGIECVKSGGKWTTGLNGTACQRSETGGQ